MSGVRLYVGADAVTVQRRRCYLTGRRCFSAAHTPRARYPARLVPFVRGLLDSGAFTDVATDKRLTPADALRRQLQWETLAAAKWDAPYISEAIVSYDRLIDEKHVAGRRKKCRWSVADAAAAVAETVHAAQYLAAHREELRPRKLVLACQGVDAQQYEDCVRQVLQVATPADWIGLGGWCILGWFRTWIPVFWEAARRVLPLIAAAGVRRVHIFGVLYRPVLAPLLWLCDSLGLTLSTDSSAPILAPCFPGQGRSCALAPRWEDNVRRWIAALARLHRSPNYHAPRAAEPGRQLVFWH
jgi:hypothetical protein